MKLLARIANLVKRPPTPRVPITGQVYQPRIDDIRREDLTVGLTPRKLKGLIDDFNAGDLATGIRLMTEIEEKDAHIYSVARTRRLALTGLKWEIVSAADIDDLVERGAADKAAEYCAAVLSGIETFGDVLNHLATAVGRNLAVAEIVWGGAGVETIVPIPAARLVYQMAIEPGELRIRTIDQYQGITLEPNKFIVHSPESISGTPMDSGLLRISAAGYVAKAFALKDWLIFCEVFGMPIRIARYEPSATPAEKSELLNMLQSLGADAAGIFSKAVELELKESGQRGGQAPYERIASFFNRELSKAWLGQTLTTEQGEVGSQALGKVHDEVRHDILDADINSEGATLRRDLLKPMVAFQFGPETPVPYFRRKLDESRDLRELVETSQMLVNMGLGIDRNWLAAEAGVKLAENEEDALQPAATPSFGFPMKGITPPRRGSALASTETPATAGKLRHGGKKREQLVLSSESPVDGYAEEVTQRAGELYAPLAQAIAMLLPDEAEGRTDVQLIADVIAGLDGREMDDLAATLKQLTLVSNLTGRADLKFTTEARRRGEKPLLALRAGRGETRCGGREATTRLVNQEASGVARLPFVEAIEALVGHIEITRADFDELDRQAKGRVFTVAWQSSVRAISDIHAALAASLATGETLHEFRRRIPQMFATAGWGGERPWHADLVFRQQSMMSYQAGRYQQMNEFGVTHWRYSSMGDGRTRPEHAALDGKIFSMNDRRFYPPWEYNCRCIAEPVFDDELEGLRVERSGDMVGKQFGSDEATGRPLRFSETGNRFEWDPAAFANVQPLDMSTVPEGLRTAFSGLLQRVQP